MEWTKLKFSKYIGKTLPEVMFKDPDWFYYSYKEGRFWGKMKYEAEEIYRKSRSINIPQNGSTRLVAEYAFHPDDGSFVGLEIVTENTPRHTGDTLTSRFDFIDMMVPHNNRNYDKLGNKLLIQKMKYYLFGNNSYRMTKAKCEAFFSDSNNFVL